MARKPNYNFEKRKRELDRQAKKDAKREERLRRKQEGDSSDSSDASAEPAPEAHAENQ